MDHGLYGGSNEAGSLLGKRIQAENGKLNEEESEDSKRARTGQ
jgi:hypothetical protein